MTAHPTISPHLLDALRSPAGPSWTELWPELSLLDDSACIAVEPHCLRFSALERDVPFAARKTLIEGGDPPPALRLCHSLDVSNFFNERTQPDQDSQELFPRLLMLPIWSHISFLTLADETQYLPSGALDGFTSLTSLVIRTREAFTSAIRDDHCHLLGQSRALEKLQSLSIEYCDISGKGLSYILQSPHLGPLKTLGLHVPARGPLLSALAAAPNVLRGLSHLTLAADHLSAPGLKKLLAGRDALANIRSLRILAAETGGYDWELPFRRSEGAKHVQQLAKAICALIPALQGLEQLEVAHGAGAPAQVTRREVFNQLQRPKDVIALALPLTMG